MMLRRLLIGLGLGVFAAVLAWLAGSTGLGVRLENATYDLRLARTARPLSPTSSVVVIEINESSLRRLEPIVGRWPWPRLIHAGVIDFLTYARARVVAYDVLFSERDTRGTFRLGDQESSGAASDAELVAAVRRAGNVVLAADASFQGMVVDAANRSSAPAPAGPPSLPGVVYRPGPGFEPRPSLTLPFAELMQAAAAVGHTYFVQDADGQARRMVPFIDVAGVAVPSLGLAAALVASHAPAAGVALVPGGLRIGDRFMPLLADPVPPVERGGAVLPSRQVLLDFPKPVTAADGTTSTYPVYSFFNVLLSEQQVSDGEKPAIDPAAFRDKVVFVGTSAAGLGDVYTTPTGGGGTPGVLLHATLADDLLSGRFTARASARVNVVVTAVLAMAAGLLAVMLPVAWATPAVLVAGAAAGAWLTHEVGAGLWIDAARPLAAGGIALFGGVAWQYFVEGRSKRQVRQLFGRYVAKGVIEELLADPSLARLGGQRREMSVLFSDIRGFTSVSERGTPESIVAQLNEYFTAMVDVLFRHQGTLDKFVGDMVMGLFGAPVADPQHADHAVAAAVDMMATLGRLNARWEAEGRPRLDIGIGINSGEMIAGNIGSSAIMSYTVIGDAVNLGSRLESLNKEYRTRILISEETRDRLTVPVETRRIGAVTVKGRTQPVVVYEVVTQGAGALSGESSRAPAGERSS
jgi:adenylate cyclase